MKLALPNGTLPYVQNKLKERISDGRFELLTNEAELKDCKTVLSENANEDRTQIDSKLEFSGERCPFYAQALIHSLAGPEGVDAEIKMNFVLLNEGIQNEFNAAKMELLAKIKIGIVQNEEGLKIINKSQVGATLIAKDNQTVSFTMAMDGITSFGNDGFKIINQIVETYTGDEQRIQFTQKSVGNFSSMVDKYFINDIEVTLKEFSDQHEDIDLPGFSNKSEPLERPILCEGFAYNKEKHDLAEIRQRITSGTINELAPVNNLNPVYIFRTGESKLTLNLTETTYSLDVDSTIDASRFSFYTRPNETNSFAGKITYLHDEPADLSQEIGKFIIRLKCQQN